MSTTAAAPLHQVVRPTTFIEPVRLRTLLGIELTLASETFQRTGSFKFRAAYNVALNAKEDTLITASSGNFGQALAYACSLLGKRCLVVMPDNSAKVKVDAVREFGGVVDLVETKNKSRAQRVAELAAEHPQARVCSAYDDTLVIAGNASLGKELATQTFDVIVSPVGGGGLSAGIVQGLREAGSSTKVIAAEPSIANDFSRSLTAGQITAFESEPQTIADGARTLSVGKHNWDILKTGLDRVVEVSEAEIERALYLLFSLANLKCEPTGALSLAAVLAAPELFKKRKVCCVVSGGNVDPDIYIKLISRAASSC